MKIGPPSLGRTERVRPASASVRFLEIFPVLRPPPFSLDDILSGRRASVPRPSPSGVRLRARTAVPVPRPLIQIEDSSVFVGKNRIRHTTTPIQKFCRLSIEDNVIQIQSRSMSGTTLSDIDCKNGFGLNYP